MSNEQRLQNEGVQTQDQSKHYRPSLEIPAQSDHLIPQIQTSNVDSNEDPHTNLSPTSIANQRAHSNSDPNGNLSPFQSGQKQVAFDPNASRHTSVSGISARQWLSHRNRKQTIVNESLIENRAFRHSHIFRRPEAMQYYNPGQGGVDPNKPEPLSRRSSNEDDSSGIGMDREERSTDDVAKQLLRVDLFVDLIWVGIIANLSGNFGEQAFSAGGLDSAAAFGEFMLLFIPIWRTWDYLREYCTNFYKDDFIQRNFIVWILLLSVVYGINAPFAWEPDDEENSLKLVIAVYLIIRASFVVMHGFQAGFLPFLRRQYCYSLIMSFFTGALWVGAMYAPYPGKLVLLIVANAIEQPIAIVLESPVGDRLITGGWVSSRNVEHYRDRHEGFFIIILGEGVFRLIEGSPTGIGLNHSTGTVLTALMLYYMLHWLYFNGDHTREFIHALRRTWYKPVIWKAYHITLFGSLLILASSVLFLIENDYTRPEDVVPGLDRREESGAETGEEAAPFIIYALWSAAISLSIAVWAMTVIALLNRSLDKPGTLVVDSRYVRLATRIPAIIVICCLPLIKSMNGATFIGAATSLLYGVFVWEWTCGLEKNWHWFEGKGEQSGRKQSQ